MIIARTVRIFFGPLVTVYYNIMKINSRILFFLLLLSITAWAQPSFDIISLDGTARVQRSQKRAWEKLAIGGKLFDNDLVETFFQTKLIMQFGESNIVIIGSNSKALLNITPKTDGAKTRLDVSITVFSGGIFSKAINNCQVSIYTANAVGVMDSGSVSTVADGKTGETGFQVLGGSIFVRNIAQQDGIELRAGLTTMIQPNKEPTAPLYITYRHVAVLKHFFGDDYVTAELDASGIKPTDEGGRGRDRSSFSTKSKEYVDEGMYQSIFSLNKIYGSILDDQETNTRLYHSIPRVKRLVPGKGVVTFNTDFGFSQTGVSPRFMPSVAYGFGSVEGGVRFTMGQSAAAAMNPGFSSLAGLLDKVAYLSLGTDAGRLSAYGGPIEQYTFGSGIMVDDFSNQSPNYLFHPLGVMGKVRINDDLTIQAFTADLAVPLINGIYASYELLSYQFGLGYVTDVNQYVCMVSGDDARYVAYPLLEVSYPDPAINASSVHVGELDFKAYIINNYDLEIIFLAEFAQKLFAANDGFVTRVPTIRVVVPKMQFGGGIFMESGKLLLGEFNATYLANRFRIKSSQNNFIDTILTPNNILDKKRQSLGMSFFFSRNLHRGAALECSYQQEFKGKKSVHVPGGGVGAADTVSRTIRGGFAFKLKGMVNDSLVKFIRYGELSLEQSHGRLFPDLSSPFASWTFQAGYIVRTIPLFFNMAFETGARFFYIDSGSELNNRIDDDDALFEISAGIHWGFR